MLTHYSMHSNSFYRVPNMHPLDMTNSVANLDIIPKRKVQKKAFHFSKKSLENMTFLGISMEEVYDMLNE